MKKNKKRIIAALSVLLIGIVTACVVFFIRTYDFSLEETQFTTENKNGYIRIIWDNTEGADGYYIFKEHNGKSKKAATVVNSDSYNDEEIENAGEYTYSVVAFSSSGKSFYKSEKKQVYVAPPAITGCDNTVNGVALKWSATEKADGYGIFRKTGDEGEAQPVARVQGGVTEYCDATVILADTYCYTVVAYIGEYSSESAGEIKIDFIPATENVKAENTVEGIKVSWDEVSAVEGYEIYRRNGENDEWKRIATVSDPKTVSFCDKDIGDRTFYEYKVNTYAGELKSNYNNITAKTFFISPTLIKNVELRENGFHVSWYKNEGIDGYIILRKTQGEKEWIPVWASSDGNQEAYTDTTAESGKSYSYTVSQAIGEYASAYIENDESRLFVATPVLQVKNSPSGVRLSWTKSSGAAEYRIYRKMSGEEEWTEIDAVKGDGTVSCIDKSVTYGEKVRYRIKAWVDDENESLMRKSVSLYAVDPDKPMVALTYDDGPYAPVTNSIIKTLKKHNARATFFIVGSRTEEFEDCIKKADKAGCEIANHTFAHTNLTKAKKKEIQSEISKTNKAVEAVIGKSPVLVRAPGGAVDDKVKKYVEYPLINWSVDTLDWKYRNASSVIAKTKNGVKDGSIVLMHDLYESTAAASKKIIPWLIEEGYQLVTVSEMMDAKGMNIKKGELYTKAEQK